MVAKLETENEQLKRILGGKSCVIKEYSTKQHSRTKSLKHSK